LFAAEYTLAIEELLEIYVNDVRYAVTMRSPGDDKHLVVGFCFSEGLVDRWNDFVAIEHYESVETAHRLMVTLRATGKPGTRVGKPSIDLQPVARHDPICLDEIWRFKSLFDHRQELFTLTGATHSVAMFERTRRLVAFAEDIGRHNAFDKAMGQVLCTNRMEQAYLAIVSSRLSFEMVRKAGRSGLQILCGLSAPTSMAVTMAENLNITLIGFLRDRSLTLYTHPERIIANHFGTGNCGLPLRKK